MAGPSKGERVTQPEVLTVAMYVAPAIFVTLTSLPSTMPWMEG